VSEQRQQPPIVVVPTDVEADYARDAQQVLDRAVAEVQQAEPDVRIEST
jgi:hypothetical protein